MKVKYFTTALAIAGMFSWVQAQQPGVQPSCGTEVPSQQWEEEFQKLLEKTFPSQAAKSQPALYTIPVIIHVIHGGQAVGTYPNLAQGQLESQIKVLNQDFGGNGFNSGNYNPQAYSNWAAAQTLPSNNMDVFGRVKIANCMVQFCMATEDTAGNPLPEPGIDRINYVTRGWSDPYAMTSYNAFKNLIDNTIKPQSIWDVTKYMNIWVTDERLNSVGLLGYATFPPVSGLVGLPGSGGTATTDGFWCYAKAFGSIDQFPTGFYTAANQRGRTSTHEIGHYLGLRHIWGDGTCATDYCNDTPPASGQNFGAPNYPHKVSSCASNSPDGEMFMNFMDYTDDPAKYMFTEDQATRIQTAMANSPYRKFLGTHNLCTVKDYSASAAFNVPSTVCGTGAAITLSNQTSGVPVPNYTWAVSGGAIMFPSNTSPMTSVIFNSPGIYTVTLTADNGTISTVSKTVSVVVPSIGVSGVQPFECEGKEVTLTMSGGNYYAWTPSIGNTSNTTSFTVAGVVEYTVTAFLSGSCKTTTIVNVQAVDCSGIKEQASSSAQISFMPNPAYDEIKITVPADGGNLSLIDISGKVVLEQAVSLGNHTIVLPLSDIQNGWYFVKWQGNTSGTSTKALQKN